MPLFHFPGDPTYLRDAAQRIGRPDTAVARHTPALAPLANPCAQAAEAKPDDIPGLLLAANAFRDQLHAASLAAEPMLSNVRNATGIGLPASTGDEAAGAPHDPLTKQTAPRPRPADRPPGPAARRGAPSPP